MLRRTLIWSSLLMAVATASCAALLGIDQDYREETDPSSGSSGPTTGSGGFGGMPGTGGTGPTAGPGGGGSGTGTGGTGPVDPPSCTGLPTTCGPMKNQACCRSDEVVGGMFLRDDEQMYPATISTFRLDRFEVTVGRFRKFVEAYPASKPQMGAGKHPKVTGSGFTDEWLSELPPDQNGLLQDIYNDCFPNDYPTWTALPGSHEDKPMNCVNWYEAFAFCVWDGGRLPTEAEWNYAASGGSIQRTYPWGDDAPTSQHAAYNCTADGSSPLDCSIDDIPTVGSRSTLGDGLWHQADLAGSLWEWAFDAFDYYLPICEDCAKVDSGNGERINRGGSYYSAADRIATTYRTSMGPKKHRDDTGWRCARETK